MQVGIIGLGLIGGSMAIDLKKRGFAQRIVGVDSNPLHTATAKQMNLIDEVVDIDTCINTSDIIIVAVPVNVATQIIPKLLDKVDKQIITDVCSIKEKINEAVHSHPHRANFVSSHPMAGTEYSGPWAAISGLFDGNAVIICNAEKSSPYAIETIKNMYSCLNMRVVFMPASNHDMHTAYVSHISHITSFALALTVLEKEKNEKNIFDLASGGFSSTVRLAKSDADMWTPIFSQNKDNILAVMDTYIKQLEQFKYHIEQHNETEIKKLIHNANKIKRIIR